MDDLSGMIQNLLQDPQTMAQVQSLAKSLGLGDTTPSMPSPESSSALSMLQNLLPAQAQNEPQDNMMSLLLRAAPLLTTVNQEDNATRFLTALRPLLSEARQKKLDEAGRILKLLRLLPLLKESGLLQNIL